MNPKNMRKLITDVMKRINHHYQITKTDINLIEMTFLMESGMHRIYHDGVIDKRGMFMVSSARLDEIINTLIRPSKKAKDNILEVSRVDIDSDDMDDLFEASTYNLAFQIVVLFYFYFNKMGDMPRDVEECSKAYYAHWKRYDNISGTQRSAAIKAFLEYDREAKKV